jgi:hypothetical protein
MMNAVFAMQGIGQFTAAIIALIVTSGFEESLKSATKASTCTGVCQLAVDKMWRVIMQVPKFSLNLSLNNIISVVLALSLAALPSTTASLFLKRPVTHLTLPGMLKKPVRMLKLI